MFISNNNQEKSILNIRSPLLFLSLMLSVLAVILSVWLIACGFLLELPLIAYTPLKTLGFIFGFVWGFFASSWALLLVMQPNLTNFASFSHVLLLDLQGAPVLYALHFLCLTAIICWGYLLFRGIIARTQKRTKTLVKIGTILIMIVLTILIIDLLFGDVIFKGCQISFSSSSCQKGWFTWLSEETAMFQESITNRCEMAANIANLVNSYKGETAGELITKLFHESCHRINQEVARLPTEITPQGSIQIGLQTVTEKVLTLATQVTFEDAFKSAGESMLKLLRLGK